MIRSFKHKGLKRFFESGTTRGIQSAHVEKLELQLDALNTAVVIEDMRIITDDNQENTDTPR